MPWFARINDKEAGPFSSSELKNLVASGTITLEHMVRQDDGDWVKASSIPGLNEFQWMMKSGEGVSGPYNSATIKEFAALGVVTPDTRIKRTSDAKWLLAGEIRGLDFRPEEMLEDDLADSVPPPVPKQATFDAIEHHSIDPILETTVERFRDREHSNEPEHPSEHPSQPIVITQAPVGNSGVSTAGLIFSCLGWLTCGLFSPVGAFLCFLGLFAKGSKSHAVAGLIVGFPGVFFLLTFGLGFLTTVLGFLGILGFGVTSSFEASKVNAARASLLMLSNCVTEYQIEIGKFPQSLESLVSRPIDVEEGVWFPKLKELPKDPWNNPFEYEIFEDSFVVSSNGPDGIAGTPDDLIELGPAKNFLKELPKSGRAQPSDERNQEIKESITNLIDRIYESSPSDSDDNAKNVLDGTDESKQLNSLAVDKTPEQHRKEQEELADRVARRKLEWNRRRELQEAEKEQNRKEREEKERIEKNRKIIDATDYRYWSSKDKKFFVTADLLRLNETTVTLKRLDNDMEIEVQIEKLSESDTEYINSLR